MASVADMLQAKGAPAPDAPNPYAQFTDEGNPYAQFAQPKAAPHRTAGEAFGMGVRNVMENVGGLADVVATPLNNTINDLMPGQSQADLIAGRHPGLGTTPGRTLASSAADAMGLAKPETPIEKLEAAIQGGATQGVLTAGLGMAGAGLEGGLGAVARGLAAAPLTDVVASGMSTGAQETARQSGAGPIGQTVAALLGGMAGIGGVAAAERAASRVATKFGPKAAKAVEAVPEEAAITPEGHLTDEGREVAANAGLHPDELKAAYQEQAAAQTEAQAAPTDAPIAAEPAPEAQPVQTEAPAAAPDQSFTPANDGTAIPPSAAARLDQAATEGVPLTKGQATQDFATQDAEQTLKAQASGEGEKARQFFVQQQQAIADAVDRFKQAFGDPSANATERGQVVKDAVRDLRDSGKAGVSALYRQAQDLAQGMGDGAQNLIHLDTAPLLAKMRELFIDESVPDQVRKAIKQQAAKYGLIGSDARTVEGETTVTLKDAQGKPASTISFTGPPQRLTIANAEDLRQKINQLYDADTSKASQALKPVLDDAVQAAVERAAAEGTGNVGQAFQAARQAHQTQRATFAAKDIVQKIIDWKSGTKTDALAPEGVVKAIFSGGPEGLTNLKRIKAVLLSKPTPASKAAWQAIQAHGVSDIFDKAMVLNANPGGGMLGTISGAKLNTAIAKFGADKLKVLLAPDDFNQLMKLRRIISDATIPISGTVNHSNTAQKVLQFLAGWGLRTAKALPLVREVAQGVEEIASHVHAKSTGKGVTQFTPQAAAKADAPAVTTADHARRFLSLAGSDQILAPLLAASANENRP